LEHKDTGDKFVIKDNRISLAEISGTNGKKVILQGQWSVFRNSENIEEKRLEEIGMNQNAKWLCAIITKPAKVKKEGL